MKAFFVICVALSLIFKGLAIRQLMSKNVNEAHKKRKYLTFNLGFYICIIVAFVLIFTDSIFS